MRNGALWIFLIIGIALLGSNWKRAWNALGKEVARWTEGALELPAAE